MSAATAPLMTAAGVSFAYAQAPVLRDVRITLAPGEIVALIGPNGSGKSTLIKSLLGQLPAGGEVTWDGRPLRQWRRRELARLVAHLPQFPAWEPQQRVREALSLGRAPYWGPFGIESPRDVQVIDQVIEQLDLRAFASRRMGELSGGQRQRLYLARALIQEPRALLLDEPDTYLDLRHEVELARVMRELARQRSLALLVASHDINLAAALADRLVLLHDGAVAADGTPGDVLQPELLARVYGVPMQRIDRPGKSPILVADSA